MVMDGEGGWEILNKKTRVVSSAAEFEGPLSRIADKGVSHNGVIHMAGQMIGCRKPRAYKDEYN